MTANLPGIRVRVVLSRSPLCSYYLSSPVPIDCQIGTVVRVRRDLDRHNVIVVLDHIRV